MFALIFQFIPLFAISANSDQFFLQQLDNRNGLSNSAINHVFQDSDNIIWVATWDGLNMLDGSSFRVFNYNKENDSKSLGSNVIQHITEDKQRNIWISTIEGISRFEKRSGKFYNYFYTQTQRSRVSEQEFELAVDRSGKVFCLTQKYGLTYYDAKADTFLQCNTSTKSPQNQSTSRISKLVFDEFNHLWLLNRGNLERYSLSENQQVKLENKITDQAGITNFFFVNKKMFFTTAANQLKEIDCKTLQKRPVINLDHGITEMIFYKEHYLLGWSTKGFAVYDHTFKPSTFLQKEAGQMKDIKVTSWALGTEQILWYGTDGNGVIKIYPKTKFFETVNTSENGMPYNRSVRTFTEENGNLWVGTKGSGIFRYTDFQSENSSSDNFLNPGELDNNSVYELKKSSDDLIYIGSDGNGLGIFDIKANKFIKWANVKRVNQYPEFRSVYSILESPDKSLWIGTSGYGLIHLKIVKEAGGLTLEYLESYKFKNNNTGPANDIIYSVTQGGNNQLWIACRYGGLSLLDLKTRKFKTFKASTYEGSLSNNDVLAVFKDSKNRIWVGTSYGLNWIDQKDAALEKPIFKKLTTANGLPNNTIHAIEEDKLGNIWVSTNKGLAKVQPSSLEISRYQQIDGLQSNEFSDGAVWKNSEGLLFFGGTYGFNYFFPQNIYANNSKPNLMITDIQLGGYIEEQNGLIVLKPNQQSSIDYILSRKDNYFDLQLKAISYLNSEKCEYAYFLEGNDKIWHYSGTSGKLVYSNIPPGNYTLKVKWSNGEGVWTNEASVFSLEVKNYFWLTYPALLFYFLVLTAGGYIVFSYRKNRQEIKQQLVIEHRLREKEEILHQEQLGFFTNIAHELQTPLTLIMGSTEQYLEQNKNQDNKQGKPYFLSLIHQQASRLSYLVQQLLEFRKAEAGHLKIQYSYLNVSELLDKLSSLFGPMSEQNKMTYKRIIPDDIFALIDKDKLEKIMFNLLSNAFKHSEKKESVTLLVSENQLKNQLEISVANSGCGLPDENLEKLFDKFYVSNSKKNGKFGTGIGLAFTRQLVILLNGKIEVSSKDNWIIFKVLIPIPKENFVSSSDDSQQLTTNPSSFLFKSMTLAHSHTMPTAMDHNKQSIIENLELSTRKSILIVEDESAIRYLLNEILKGTYTIYEAEDGKQALDLIQKVIPDLIISDIMMPDMDGLELCNRIKTAPATCHIPFVVLSAKGSIEHRTEGYEVGADAYIAKPFHVAHLQVRIRKLLEYRERLEEFFNNDVAGDFILNSDLPDNDKQFLSNLLSVIEKKIDEPELNAAVLENELSMSKMQLYRKLKTLTQMTPGEFIKQIRLKQAASLLISTNLTVSEIFYRTGFNNQSYFYREFKKRYQFAPNEYRAQQQVQV